MPDLNYPAQYPFADGDAVTSANVQELIYSPTSPSASLAILNGNLDENNIGDVLFQPEHTQRGSAIDSDGSSGNASLDYWNYHWADHDTDTWDPTDLELARVVPGCTHRFYMPWTGRALINWTVFWTNTSEDDDKKSAMFLNVDGAYIPSQRRFVGRCLNGLANPASHEGYKRSRVWSGHHFPSLSRGWHSASIRLVGDEEVQQTRVWARNMTVVRVKGP